LELSISAVPENNRKSCEPNNAIKYTVWQFTYRTTGEI